jgi:hypothetical protein
MITAEQRRSPVFRQLEAYGESWKRDHDTTMACRDWEDAIAVGINVFHMMLEREKAWRYRVFRGASPYSDDDNRDHQARFANWIETTGDLLAIVPELEARFGAVEGAAALRRCTEQAEAIVKAWQPPRLAAAVGQREMVLSPEAARELDDVIERAASAPPPMLNRRWEVRDASFLKPSS